MAINFPNTPTPGSIFTAGTGSWKWDGSKWDSSSAVVANLADITAVIAGVGLNGGGTSGDVTLNLTVPVSVANGGTGATTPSAALANLGGLSTNQPITLTGDVTGFGTTSIPTTLGTVPTTKGGTGLVTYAQGDILYSPSTNTLARLAKDATATRYLSNSGASNNPAWSQINLSNGVTGVLPVANGGTGATTAPAGAWVAKTGDTMTGSLNIQSGSNLYVGDPPFSSAGITLDKNAPGASVFVNIFNKDAAVDGTNAGIRLATGGWNGTRNNTWYVNGNRGTVERSYGTSIGSDVFYWEATTMYQKIFNYGGLYNITNNGGPGYHVVSAAGTNCSIRLQSSARIHEIFSVAADGAFGLLDVSASRWDIYIDTSGNCYNVTGTWNVNSDERMKKEVTDYTHGLTEVRQLNPVAFKYNGEGGTVDDGIERFGLIAQQVQPILPELVGSKPFIPIPETKEQEDPPDPTDREAPVPIDYLTLDPGRLIYSLVNAIKELADRLEVLEAAGGA